MTTNIQHLAHKFLFSLESNSLHSQVLKEWPTIVGKLKTHVRLEKTYKDYLVLGVYESAWMQELYLLSNMLLNKINSHLENAPIKKLRFVLVEKSKFKFKTTKKNDFTFIRKEIPLNANESQALAKIIDQELAQELQRFLSRCKTK